MAVVKIPAFYNPEINNETITTPVPDTGGVSVNCYTEKLAGGGFATNKRYGFQRQDLLSVSGTPFGIHCLSETTYGTGQLLWNVGADIYYKNTGDVLNAGTLGRLYYACSTAALSGFSNTVVLKVSNNLWHFLSGATVGGATHVAAYNTVVNPNAVGGLVYLDGTYYSLTAEGKIYGSGVEDPTTWSALNMIQTAATAGRGVFIGKYYKYVVAFNTYSTQFFFNAGNPTGSPLSVVPNTYIEFGLVGETAIQKIGDTYFWIGQTKTGQMKVATLVGLEYQIVSNAAIEKILTSYRDSGSSDQLTYVTAAVNIEDRVFFVISLARNEYNNNTTLVYDTTDKTWSFWTYYAKAAEGNVTLALGSDNLTVTVTHALPVTDQSFVTISGNGVAAYNGTFPVNAIGATQFSYVLPSPATSAPSGITVCTTWNERAVQIYSASVYDSMGIADTAQRCIVQLNDGSLVTLSKAAYSDTLVSGVTSPIPVRIRTDNTNFDEPKSKVCQYVEVIGDKVQSTLHYRITNNDFATYNRYVMIPLHSDRSRKFASGRFHSRAFDFVHVDNTPLRIQNFMLDIFEGM